MVNDDIYSHKVEPTVVWLTYTCAMICDTLYINLGFYKINK